MTSTALATTLTLCPNPHRGALPQAIWGRKGATLSDKTARSEYGLTQEEIYAAIDAGKLQYRPAAMHGNPWLRLLRREGEELVRTRSGDRYRGNGRRGPNWRRPTAS
jgi:hypothetical protein